MRHLQSLAIQLRIVAAEIDNGPSLYMQVMQKSIPLSGRRSVHVADRTVRRSGRV